MAGDKEAFLLGPQFLLLLFVCSPEYGFDLISDSDWAFELVNK